MYKSVTMGHSWRDMQGILGQHNVVKVHLEYISYLFVSVSFEFTDLTRGLGAWIGASWDKVPFYSGAKWETSVTFAQSHLKGVLYWNVFKLMTYGVCLLLLNTLIPIKWKHTPC